MVLTETNGTSVVRAMPLHAMGEIKSLSSVQDPSVIGMELNAISMTLERLSNSNSSLVSILSYHTVCLQYNLEN